MALVERVLGRMNCVSIDGVKSGLLPVVSGCHKVVSLVLCSSWSMLMIYQTMIIHSKLLLFADDAKCFRRTSPAYKISIP